jgi:hypothetical protein
VTSSLGFVDRDQVISRDLEEKGVSHRVHGEKRATEITERFLIIFCVLREPNSVPSV